jgi:hypothetical protein
MRYFSVQNISRSSGIEPFYVLNILFFVHNIFRDPPMTKLKISPQLELVMPYRLLSLVMIPGIIIGIAGQKRDLASLLMNGIFLPQTPVCA